MMIVVFFYGIDIVDGQGSAVVYAVVEYFKSIAIVPVQPIVGAEPHETIVVLTNADDRIVGKSLLYAKVSDGYIFGQKRMAMTNNKKERKAAIYTRSEFSHDPSHLAY